MGDSSLICGGNAGPSLFTGLPFSICAILPGSAASPGFMRVEAGSRLEETEDLRVDLDEIKAGRRSQTKAPDGCEFPAADLGLKQAMEKKGDGQTEDRLHRQAVAQDPLTLQQNPKKNLDRNREPEIGRQGIA